jgi:hypothetical protein
MIPRPEGIHILRRIGKQHLSPELIHVIHGRMIKCKGGEGDGEIFVAEI